MLEYISKINLKNNNKIVKKYNDTHKILSKVQIKSSNKLNT